MNRQNNKVDQTVKETNRKREEKLVHLTNERKKRQEQLAYQQLHLQKKKNLEKQSTKRESIVRFEDNENEHDESSSPLPTPSVPLPINSTEKLMAHKFYNVHAEMTEEEWIEARDAFVAKHFQE